MAKTARQDQGALHRIAARIAGESKLPEAKKLVDKHIKESFREIGPLALSKEDAEALKDHVKKQWGIK